jgi:hypothetical protein
MTFPSMEAEHSCPRLPLFQVLLGARHQSRAARGRFASAWNGGLTEASTSSGSGSADVEAMGRPHVRAAYRRNDSCLHAKHDCRHKLTYRFLPLRGREAAQGALPLEVGRW